ncbi:MAG: hypothetical protein ABEJ61_06015 [Haloferacaceae archaeon]
MTDNDSHTSNRRIDRRRFIAAAGATGIAGLAGCSGGGGEDTPSGSGSGGSGSGSGGSGGSGSGSGGTTTGENSGSTVTLLLMSGSMSDEPSNKKYWQNAAERFGEQVNGAEMELRGVPYPNQFKKIRASIQAGQGDVPHLNEVSNQINNVQAGEVLRLKEEGLWGQSKLSEKIADGVLSLNEKWGEQVTGTEGKLVTWGVGLRPFMNAYRKDWLSAAGLSAEDVNRSAGAPNWYDGSGSGPSMFNEVYPAMNETDLAAPDDAAPDTTGMKQADEEILVDYIAAWGVSLMGPVNNAATRSILDTERGRDVIRFQKEGIDKGYFHPNSINHGDEEATTLMWSNKMGAIHVQDTADLWGSFRQQLGPDKYEQNYTWGLPPVGPGSEGQKAMFSVNPALIPFAQAYDSQAEKDASVDFIDFFTGSEESIVRTKNLGWVPANPTALEGDWFSSTSLHEKYWSTVKTLVEDYTPAAQPAVQGTTKISFEIPRKMHQRILQQEMSVEKATQLAADEINQILKDQGRYQAR